MMPKKKEVGTKQPELHEVISILEEYRSQLFHNKEISPTKFAHMQTALHWAKQLVRVTYGAPVKKREIAWVK